MRLVRASVRIERSRSRLTRVRRIRFLVDTRNLGEQAEQEVLAHTSSDDNRKFTELYTVQRLNSCHVPKDAEVCISTSVHRSETVCNMHPTLTP